jgi:prepilin signal peptidase PulO-like enzyme (type II secretory pathway)
MTWPLALAVGLVLGIGLSFYRYWLPQRIQEEEAYWVAKLSGGKDREPVPPKGFRQALRAHSWFSQQTIFLVVACGVLSVLLAARHPVVSPWLIVFACTLLALAVIDWETQLLPDELTLGLLWVGLISQFVDPGRAVGLEQAVIGAAVGYLVLWVTGNVFRVIRGIEGLGYGDMKLLAAIGAWLGPSEVIYVVLLGSLVAVCWQLLVVFRKKLSLHTEFAFGPWLILAALIRII